MTTSPYRTTKIVLKAQVEPELKIHETSFDALKTKFIFQFTLKQKIFFNQKSFSRECDTFLSIGNWLFLVFFQHFTSYFFFCWCLIVNTAKEKSKNRKFSPSNLTGMSEKHFSLETLFQWFSEQDFNFIRLWGFGEDCWNVVDLCWCGFSEDKILFCF